MARRNGPIRRAIDYVAYLAVRIARCVVEIVSLETCETVCDGLAEILTYVVPLRRKTVDENLRRVFPESSPAERRELTYRMWRHLLLMACEIAYAERKVRDVNWRRHVRIEDRAEVVRRLLDDRPRLFVSGHFGNFEFASYFLGVMGFRCYAIARDLDNPYLHRYVTRVREAKGQFILPKDGSAPLVDRLLKQGQLLALLGDQYAGPKGCWTEFLGQPSSCHKALAVFTLSGGAPMTVMGARRLDKPLRFSLEHGDSIDPRRLPSEIRGVRDLTAWYNERLSRLILAEPGQYWWLHRRWKGDPPANYAKAASVPAESAARKAA